jgi:RNA polymerase sigma-70 factor, ECF subfamily
MTGLSDEDLMDKACGGDERALEIIYQRYSQPLLRYFYRMLWQDKSKAEDFLHDLFIKIMEKQIQFDSERKFSTWIYSIANNMCKNEYRKQAFRSSIQHSFNGNAIIAASITQQLDHASFHQTLERLLVDEGEEARTLFVLRHELDMSVAEISQVINCPEGTVKSRLFYLKKKLALALEHYKVVLEK